MLAVLEPLAADGNPEALKLYVRLLAEDITVEEVHAYIARGMEIVREVSAMVAELMDRMSASLGITGEDLLHLMRDAQRGDHG